MSEQYYLHEWHFRSASQTDWLPAVVPGCVHTDLYRNGQIADPFYGQNERDLQWIDKIDWEYETVFDCTKEMLGCSNVELVFEGLDTYADIYLNNQLIIVADNMFREWRANVSKTLCLHGNSLTVRLRSPIQEGLKKLKDLGYALPAQNDQSERGGLGDRRVSVFSRKAPYHFGWDWGPRFVTSGIWKEVYLQSWSGFRISDFCIRQRSVTSKEAQVTAIAQVEADEGCSGILRVTTEQFVWEKDVKLIAGSNLLELDVEIVEPKLWWCNGMGEPHLYEWRAELLVKDMLITKTVKTGLRSIKLVRETDEAGSSFYFALNGVPLFIKGANHIPNDSFVSEVTKESYLHEIGSAVDSHMNMLRVWGGGIYEHDIFYDLCDRYGILVWQDFMFACSMYPGDGHFLLNVRAEAEHQIIRLRNHPCIALWCGNNEMDTAWAEYDEQAGWGWKQQYSPEIRERVWQGYDTLFHHLLPDAVTKLAPETDYWASSPMRSLSRDRNQHSDYMSADGDIHYWGVWHGGEPFENYNKFVGRFMSEYGFQSFPEPDSVRKYAGEEDYSLESGVMLDHQRHERGNALIKEYMERYLPQPKDFSSFLILSQILQAEAVKTAIEAHRRNKPYCSGTLFWQLNDCWPVASWSSIDYYGKWKAAQYEAKRCYRNLTLSIEEIKAGLLNVHAISDLCLPFEGLLYVALMGFDGVAIREWRQPISLQEQEAAIIWSVQVSEMLTSGMTDSCFLVAELSDTEQIVASRIHFFVPLKCLTLPNPCISMTESEDGTKRTLETDLLALKVRLSSEETGEWSDNFFDLVPGKPITVEFRSRTGSGLQPGSPGKIEIHTLADWIRGEG